MIPLDDSILRAIAPRVYDSHKAARQREIIAAIGPVLPAALARCKIDTALRQAHFLSQIAHESDGFCTTVEYASGDAYETRTDLGNTPEIDGDGRLYRGRGLIQLTGRDNYVRAGRALGLDLAGDPTLAADPVTSLRVACWYWGWKGLNPIADRDDLEAITRRINGGLNGLADRRGYLVKAKAVLGIGRRPILRRGEMGELVRLVQRHLGIPADGIFGPNTQRAVRQHQQQCGLVVDGVVGPRTWACLEREDGSPAGMIEREQEHRHAMR